MVIVLEEKASAEEMPATDGDTTRRPISVGAFKSTDCLVTVMKLLDSDILPSVEELVAIPSDEVAGEVKADSPSSDEIETVAGSLPDE